MKFKHILLLLIFLSAQLSIKAQVGLIVKSNIWNLPFIPSAHAELPLNKRHTLHLDFHRARIKAISIDEFLNICITSRYYFNQQTNKVANGLYIAGGFSMKHDYNKGGMVDTVFYRDNTFLHLDAKAGRQWILRKRFVLDLNAGLSGPFVQFRPFDNFNHRPQLRLMAGIGYNFY